MSVWHQIGVLLLVLASPILVHAQAPVFGLFEEQVQDVGEVRSIAIAPDGSVLVGSRVGHDYSGRLAVDAWGRSATTRPDGSLALASANGEVLDVFKRASSITAIDLGENRLAILDEAGNAAVYAVSPAGKVSNVALLDTAGFLGARGIALDPDGGVWIADTDRQRLVHLGPSGEESLAFGGRGAFPGLFNTPSGIDVHDGHVYVADTLNHRISVHDAGTGEFQYQWGMHAVVPRQGEGRIHYPEDVAVAPDGSFVAVLEPFERRYQRFVAMPPGEDPSGKLPQKLAVESHFGPQLGVHNDLLVMHEPESSAAMVFDLRKNIPIHVTTFGRPGSGGSQFGRITSIGVDADEQEIWFLDEGNRRISVWRLDRDRDARLRQDPFMGKFVRSIGFDALAAEADGFVPRQLLVDNGKVHLLARDGRGVLTLARNLDVLGTTEFSGQSGMVPSWLAGHPEGGWVGVGTDGYVVGTLRVMPDGEVLPLVPMGETSTVHPVSIAPLANGMNVVAERAGDRLIVLGSDGSVRSIGESGSWDGALWLPGEIHPFSGGRVVVVDQGNHRAQVFDPKTGEWSMTFSLGMGHEKPMFLKKDFITESTETSP